MPKLLVMADDLSGATDVGVQFANKRVGSFVVIRSDQRSSLQELFRQFEVVVVNTESRHVSPSEARRTIAMLTEEARLAGIELFYKKTDSTLRGNVGAELDALWQGTGQRTLCFVPAHPALGRTTRDGVQFVHGQELHRTGYARDLRNPFPWRESRVSSFLQQETSAPLSLVRQNELRDAGWCAADGIVVFDAETEEDVLRCATAIRAANCLSVLAGSAALASCLPDLVPFERNAGTPPSIPRQFLIVNGSLNELALRQCAEAERQGFAWLLMPPEALLEQESSGDAARASVVEQVVALLTEKRDVILGNVKHPRELAQFNSVGERISPVANDWPERIAFNTGRITAEIFSRYARRSESQVTGFTLCVVGGDTLAGISHANGWRGFLPRRELERGLAVCEVPERPGLVLFTKPGGFGDEQTLSALCKRPVE